ncbi:carboxypeptidase-like regulatory domain-containing protein [bacterium]|nr:carboxypeptidase-like regulatory domain-containing protein [bacterium]MDC3307501.1 carboxypeptidase-like regulatory domain-containing protein [bacterium]
MKSTQRSRLIVLSALLPLLGTLLLLHHDQGAPSDEVIPAVAPIALSSDAGLEVLSLDTTPWGRSTVGAAERPAVEQASGPEQAYQLMVVSAEDYGPVADARIRIPGLTQTPIQAQGDPEGRVAFGVPAERSEEGCLAIVEAEGFCRRVVSLYPTAGDVLVALAPAASLAVTLTDERGEPVPGTRVQLLPPDVQGGPWRQGWRSFSTRLLGPGVPEVEGWLERAGENGQAVTAAQTGMAHTATETLDLTLNVGRGRSFDAVYRDALDPERWVQHTDSEGVARWSGLPADAGYRWGAQDAQVTAYEPAAELAPATYEDGMLVVTTDQPAEDVSGPFDLLAGQELELEGHIARLTGVFGIVPDAKPLEGERVVLKVFHRSSPEVERVHGYPSLELEHYGWASPAGDFQLEGVKPGSKLLRAWWREAGNRYFFAERGFELTPGDDLDLGAIHARTGSILEVSLPLVDTLGDRLAAEEYLRPQGPGNLSLTVVGWDGVQSDSPFPALQEVLPVDLGSTISLHGMALEQSLLSLDWSDEAVHAKKPGTRIELPGDVEIDAMRQFQVDLPLVLVETATQEVVVRFPEGTTPMRAEVHVVALATNETQRADLRVDAGASTASGRLQLERGPYRLLVHTHTLEEPEARGSWFAVHEGPLGTGEPIELDLVPGAAVEGIARDASGAPLADAYLFFGTGRHLQGERAGWTHKVRTGPDGSFFLRGLEPGRTYASNEGSTLAAGAAGGVAFLTLQAP